MQSSPVRRIWDVTIQPVQGNPADDVCIAQKKSHTTFSLRIDTAGAHADCHAKKSYKQFSFAAVLNYFHHICTLFFPQFLHRNFENL